MSPYDQVRLEYPQLLRENALARVCREHGMTRDSFLRECLDPKRALRLGRFAPVSEQEIRLTIKWALKDGMTLDPGWVMRWDSFARSRPYLETYSSLSERLRGMGIDFKTTVFEIALELGLPYRLPQKKVDPDHSKEIETKRALLDGAFTTNALAPFGYNRGKLIRMRKEKKLFCVAVPLDCTFFYPGWQFDGEMRVRPFVFDALTILAEVGLSRWDLEEAMGTLVDFRGRKARLSEIVALSESEEWILAHLRYRLKAASRRV